MAAFKQNRLPSASNSNASKIMQAPKHAASSFTFPDVVKPSLQLWVEATYHTLRTFFETRQSGPTNLSDSTESLAHFDFHRSSAMGQSSLTAAQRTSSVGSDRRASRRIDPFAASMDDAGAQRTSLIMSSHSADLDRAFESWRHGETVVDAPAPKPTHGGSHALLLTELESLVVGTATPATPAVVSLALESTVLQLCIYLVAIMTPSLDLELRAQLAHSFLVLADCFHEKQHPAAFSETLLYHSQTDPFLYMHVLFQETAAAFSSFAVAWVHGLSCLLECSDFSVASACLKAIQHLVHENQTQFELLDLQSTAYHLLFRLTGGEQDAGESSDNRKTILQVFLAWCPWMEKRLPEFIEKLVDALFSLRIKTIKETILICEILTQLAPNAPEFHVWIVNQVQPEDDDRLDLVHWATDRLCPTAPYPLLLDAHAASPHAYIRYGAALILSAYFQHLKEPLARWAELITLGMYDTSSPVSTLYRTVLIANASSPPTQLSALVAASHTTPLATFERMAAGLRHVGSLHVQQRTLEWMRLWAATLTKFPPLVFQVMLSLLQTEKLRSPALHFLCGITTVLAAMDPAQIRLLWKAVEPSLAEYPDLWVHFMREPGFFPALFHLLLIAPAPKRYLVYQFFYGKPALDAKFVLFFWLIGLGDTDSKNVCYLLSLLEETLPTLKPHLTNFQHQMHDPYTLLLEYDHFAQILAEEDLLSEYTRPHYKPYLDFVWATYIPGELPFPSPDDYSYQHLFRHSANWLALLLYRMNARPPLLSSEETETATSTTTTTTTSSSTPNVSHSVKRKTHLGYLTLLLPILGYPDPYIRVQSCQTLFLACFSRTILTNLTARTLIESLGLASCQKVWSYLASTFDLATLFVRSKVPLLSQSLVYQYLPLACEHASNSPFAPVRIAALHFLIACLLIFPLAMATQYSELLGTLKPLLVDPDPTLQATAHLAWTCFCDQLSEMNSLDLASVIKDSLADMAAGGPHLASDPFLQPLSKLERSTLVQRYIESLGHIHCSLEHITPICFGFLAHASPKFREASVGTLMRRLSKLDSIEKKAVLWICLPLCADPIPAVCEAANKDFVEPNILARVLPHTDDATVLTNTPPDTLFNAMLSVPLPNRTEALSSFHRALHQFKFHKPVHRLLQAERLEQLPRLAKAIGTVPQMYIHQILYYYDRFVASPPLMPSGYRSLALLGIEHDTALNTVTRTLVHAAVGECPTEALDALHFLCTHTVVGTHAVFTWLKEILTKGNEKVVELPLGAVLCFVRLQGFTHELGIQEPWIDLFYHAVVDASPLSRGFAFETKLLLARWLVHLISQDQAPAMLDQLGWMVTRDTSAFFLIQTLSERFPSLSHSVFALLHREVTSKALDTDPSVRANVAQLLSSLPNASPYTELLLADEHPDVLRGLTLSLSEFYPERVQDPLHAPKELLALVVQQEKAASHSVLQHYFAVFRRLSEAHPPVLELVPPMFQEYLQKVEQLRSILLRALKSTAIGKPPTAFIQEQHGMLQGCLMITSELIQFVHDPEVLFQVVTHNIHRGLRAQAVQLLIQHRLASDLQQSYLQKLFDLLKQPLYEKKVDVLQLLIHLLPKDDLVSHMVPLWSDSNPKIRLAAIQALKSAPLHHLETILEEIACFVAKENYEQRLELESLLVSILHQKNAKGLERARHATQPIIASH